MKPLRLVPWYHTQWCVMCQIFVFPPLGLLNLILSRAFSILAKIMTLAAVVFFLITVWMCREYYQDHLNQLWLAKFSQMKRQFRYEEAGFYLYQRELKKPEEQLMETLLRVDYEDSIGSKKADNLRNLAESQHDILFRETFDEYKNLVSIGKSSKSSGTQATQALDFDYYYTLFLREGGLNWDVRNYPITSLQQAKEMFRNDPEKLTRLKGLSQRFNQILASVASSNTNNLLMPRLVEWNDIDKIKTLLMRASVARVILGYEMGLKFYFYAYLVRSGNQEAKNAIKILGLNLEELLDDYVGQSPFNLKAFILRGLSRFDEGRLAEARLDFEYVFKLDVRYPGIWDRLKSLDLNSADMEALRLYRKAEDLRFRRASFKEAIDLFQGLLIKDWSSKQKFEDELLFNMGVIYRNNLKLYEEAIRCFNRILTIKDSFRHEEARYNLIMCYYFHRDFDSMEVIAKQFLKFHSGSDRIPRIIMLNIGMKLIKVFRKIVKDFTPYSLFKDGAQQVEVVQSVTGNSDQQSSPQKGVISE